MKRREDTAIEHHTLSTSCCCNKTYSFIRQCLKSVLTTHPHWLPTRPHPPLQLLPPHTHTNPFTSGNNPSSAKFGFPRSAARTLPPASPPFCGHFCHLATTTPCGVAPTLPPASAAVAAATTKSFTLAAVTSFTTASFLLLPATMFISISSASSASFASSRPSWDKMDIVVCHTRPTIETYRICCSRGTNANWTALAGRKGNTMCADVCG